MPALTLHRSSVQTSQVPVGTTGWEVADTGVLVCRTRPNRWKLISTSDWGVVAWLLHHKLDDAVFATRSEALRTLVACAAHDPLPNVTPVRTRLRPDGAGRYVTPDGKFEVRRATTGHAWNVTMTSSRLWCCTVLTLREAQRAIDQRTPSGRRYA